MLFRGWLCLFYFLAEKLYERKRWKEMERKDYWYMYIYVCVLLQERMCKNDSGNRSENFECDDTLEDYVSCV